MTVYLVGAGPGDPGLLTVRGAEVLGRADLVVYDRLSVSSLLRLAPAHAELVSVGKAPGRVEMSQEDINALLYRPDQNSDRRIYATQHLFEPGQATLSETGRTHLSNLASWLEAGKTKGSEVVIVSYADANSPELPDAAAQTLTQRQSEAVLGYLHDNLRAHRTGWVSSRKLFAVGMGHNPPPVPEREPMSPNRTYE